MFYSYIFIFLVLAMFSVQVYLDIRQIKHIALNYTKVPFAFEQVTTLSQHQKSSSYNIAKLKLNIFSSFIEVIILFSFTLLGGVQYIDAYLSHNIQNEYLYALALFFTIFGISSILNLPISYISQFNIEQKFGFNNMSIKLFITDKIKQTCIGIIIFSPLLCMIIFLFKQESGWFYTWTLWIIFNISTILLYPRYIAPLFNTFKPLDNQNLFNKIQTLFMQAGFKLTDILVMDGSKRSKHGNAYFTGLGKSKRIVFFDTLLNNLSENQTIAVLAHELGHLAHKHLLKRLVKMFILSLLVFYCIHLLHNYLPFYQFMGVAPHLMGITSIHSNYPLLLLLVILILPVISFFFTPIMSLSSRKDEFEADAFAAKYSNAQDLISALIALYNDNASVFSNDEIYAKFYYSHPPAGERIAALEKLCKA